MLVSVVLAAVAALVAMATGIEGKTTTTTVTPPVVCPFPLEERNGACVHTKEVAEALTATRHKRQVVVNTDWNQSGCPRCVDGVSDVFPVWEDCSKLHYCFNGEIVLLDCRNFNATYFNPVSKACEPAAQPDNICLYRDSPVLLG